MIKIFCIIIISISQARAFELTDLLRELSLSKADVNTEQVAVEDSEISDEDVLTKIVLKRKTEFRGSAVAAGTVFVLSTKRGLSSILLLGPKDLIKVEGVSCKTDIQFQNGKLCRCTIGEAFSVLPNLVLPKGSGVVFHNGSLSIFNLRKGIDPVKDSKGQRVYEVNGVKLREGIYYLVQDGKVKENDSMPENHCGG